MKHFFEDKNKQKDFEFGVRFGKAMFDAFENINDTMGCVKDAFKHKEKDLLKDVEEAIEEELHYFFCV